jgi:universal stress protein A
MVWKKLVVTTDFSTDSLRALDEAKKLIQGADAEVTLLHVTEAPFEGLRIHTETLHEEMQSTANAKLIKLAQEHFGTTCHVIARVQMGRPGTVICEVAKQGAADLIIMSSHGHSGLAHVLLGSVVEDVLRRAPCPVLVVPIGQR